MLNLPANSEIFMTADGSPTLSYRRLDGYAEKMHHSAGALSESLFIYLEALKLASVPHVLSVGLGLAYNEMLTAAHMIQKQIVDYKIWSFESLPELRDGFRNWLMGDDLGELATTLTEVERQTSLHFQLTPGDIRAELCAALAEGRLELRQAFPEDSAGVQAHVVFYDAYSRKMNAELWEEPQLVKTFTEVLSETCVLATYAATGSLNRALKQLGFRLINKTGFQGKRESTLAIRESIR